MTQGASEAASDRLHVFASAIDGNIRLVYTAARDNETAAMAIDLMNNARVFFPHTGSPDRTCADRQRIMLSSSSFRGFIRTHSLLKAFVNARTVNKVIGTTLDGESAVPAMMLLGTPARRVDPGHPLTHITAWHLDDLGTRIANLLQGISPDNPDLSADVRKIADDWLGFAEFHWMVVHEARPEVTRRRDTGSPARWLFGKKVLVLGCGALEAPIAERCVRAGAAQLHLVDNGAVTPGILVRQPYEDTDIGYGKAERLARRLSRIRRDLTVTFAIENILTRTLADPTALLGYDLIVDASADIGVQTGIEKTRAALRDRWPTTVSALFGHTAQRGVATVAVRGATGSGHDLLRRLAIDTATNPPPGWGSIAGDLFPNLPRTERFFPEPGCSAPTFTGSAADVSALSSMLFSAAITAAADPHAMPMTVLGCDLTPEAAGVRPVVLTWNNDLSVIDQTGECEVRISSRAFTEMRTEARRGHRVRGARVETGGMLFGSIDEATRIVYIDNVAGPSPDSRLSPLYFDHGTEGTQEAVTKVRASTAERES